MVGPEVLMLSSYVCLRGRVVCALKDHLALQFSFTEGLKLGIFLHVVFLLWFETLGPEIGNSVGTVITASTGSDKGILLVA